MTRQEAIDQIKSDYANGKDELIISRTVLVWRQNSRVPYLKVLDFIIGMGVKYNHALEAKMRYEEN